MRQSSFAANRGREKDLSPPPFTRRAVAQGPFVEVPCATLSEEMLDRKLFGYEEGAFAERWPAGQDAFKRLKEGRCSWMKSASFPRARR